MCVCKQKFEQDIISNCDASSWAPQHQGHVQKQASCCMS